MRHVKSLNLTTVLRINFLKKEQSIGTVLWNVLTRPHRIANGLTMSIGGWECAQLDGADPQFLFLYQPPAALSRILRCSRRPEGCVCYALAQQSIQHLA